MADKKFWNGMDPRVGGKRTDKIMVGNVDNSDTEFENRSDILKPLEKGDFPTSITDELITTGERAKLVNVPSNTNTAISTAKSEAISSADSNRIADKSNNINDVDQTKVSQISTVKNVRDNVNKDLGVWLDTYTSTGKSILLNVGVGNIVDLTPVSSPDVSYFLLDASEGDSFKVKARGGNAARLYGFINSSDELLEVSSANLNVYDEPIIITAPENTSKVILNFGTTQYPNSELFKLNGSLDIVNKNIEISKNEAISSADSNRIADKSNNINDADQSKVAQISTVKNVRDNVNKDLGYYIESYTATGYAIDIHVGLGEVVDLTPVVSTSFSYRLLDASEGDSFKVKSRGGNAARLYAFINSSDELLEVSVANNNAYNNPVVVTAPTGTAKVIFNFDTTLYPNSELFKITGALREVNKKIYDSNNEVIKEYYTKKVTNTNDYNAWAQDKSFELGEAIYFIYNRGDSHISSNLVPVLMVSYDGGTTFKEVGELNVDDGVTYSGGRTSWGAGVDDTNFYVIIRCRGANYNIGTTKHFLLYKPHNGNITDTSLASFTVKEIDVDNGLTAPILFHSFLALPNGGICFGYHFLEGEVGVIRTLDYGDNWNKRVILSQLDNNDSGIIYVEPTLSYNPVTEKIVGIFRSQKTNKPPMMFVLNDTATTVESTSVLSQLNAVSTLYSPMPIVYANGMYYSVYFERWSQWSSGSEVNGARIYLLKGSSSEVLSDTDNFEVYKIGEVPFQVPYPDSGTACGVNSLLYSERTGRLFIFYSVSEQDDLYSNMYVTYIPIVNKDDVNIIRQ